MTLRDVRFIQLTSFEEDTAEGRLKESACSYSSRIHNFQQCQLAAPCNARVMGARGVIRRTRMDAVRIHPYPEISFLRRAFINVRAHVTSARANCTPYIPQVPLDRAIKRSDTYRNIPRGFARNAKRVHTAERSFYARRRATPSDP